MIRNQVSGLVFAGGLARRMHGQAKGLLPLRGKPLLGHVLERFAPQVGPLSVNANGAPDDYAAFGYPVLADRLEGFIGPLAGLHAGLLACATPWLATVPCDAPLLPDDLVARLHAALMASDASIAAASAGGRAQPTFMLCRREVVDDLERYLSAGGRKIHVWLADMKALQVDFADAAAFANINTPEELAQLENIP